MPVNLTITGITDGPDHTVYRILVEENGAQWTILKRYTDFVNLDVLLVQDHRISRIALPEKGLFGIRKALNFDNFNEKRAQGLQEYLVILARQLQNLQQVPAIANFCTAESAENSAQLRNRQQAPMNSVQPVQAQPVQTQPVQTQPVQTQPVQAQTVQAQPVQAQPVQAKAVHAEAVAVSPLEASARRSGGDAPMTESGYRDVQHLESSFEMGIFIRRLVEAAGGSVTDESDLMDVAALFSGETATQSPDRLWEEVAQKKWTPGGMGASLNAQGYCAVAARRSNMEMQAYIRRLVSAAGGRILPEEGNAKLAVLVPLYSGEKAAQSFRSLCQDLQKKARTEGWLEFNIEALPADARAAAEADDDHEPASVAPVVQPIRAEAQPVHPIRAEAQPVMAQPAMAMATAQPVMSQPAMAVAAAQPVMAPPAMASAQPVMAMRPGVLQPGVVQPVMAQPFMAPLPMAQPAMMSQPVGQMSGAVGIGALIGAATAAVAGFSQGGLGAEQRCFKCEGRGFRHDSLMSHDRAPHEKCFFCKTCSGCNGSGHIPGGGGMMGGMGGFGGMGSCGMTQRCFKCGGSGFFHDSSMPHDAPYGQKCFFCKSCSGCHGRGYLN